MKNLSGFFWAFFASMVFFAAIHMTLLLFLALTQQDASHVNIFNILGISTYLPEALTTTYFGNLASFAIMMLVFAFFYLIKKR